VKKRRDELHFTNAELARAAGVKQRTIEAWLQPDEKRRPDIEHVEALAQKLSLGTDDICSMIPEEERALAHGGEGLLKVGRTLQIVWEAIVHYWVRYRSYARHIGLRFWPLKGNVRRFFHKGHLRNAYAEVCITPLQRPDCVPIEFIFSYRMGVIRIDYGKVVLRGDALSLVPFFAGYADEGIAQSGGAFRVWTWFGPEPCEFVVRSTDVDFELQLDERRFPREPRCRGPREADVVCFLAAPHHLAMLEAEDMH
jgi:transcriptional regulator with XRE-family HTH domain